MALSGQLSDLSLAELIEFFCNQNKTGRLKIAYTKGPGFFYFQNGSLIDAKIGILSGVDAVYYALTLENASFKFSTAFPPIRRTIHQPWAHVALEGLRRMDEGVVPEEAFPTGDNSYLDDPEYKDSSDEKAHIDSSMSNKSARAAASSMSDSIPFSMMVEEASNPPRGRALKFGIVAFAVLLIVAAVGVPAGWYGKKRPAANVTSTPPPTTQSVSAQQTPTDQPDSSLAVTTTMSEAKKNDAAEAAKRALEKERLDKEKKKEELKKQEEAKNAESAKTEQPKSGPKMVTVTVTYDESGRVVSASGGDPAALRIARQKRFPAGKGGVATVTIPVN